MTGIALADVAVHLQGKGLLTRWPGVNVQRGLVDDTALRQGRDRLLVITRGGGAGFRTEMHLRQPIITLRCVGKQGRDTSCYDDAEEFAQWVDAAFLMPTSGLVGAAFAQYVTQAGGEPTPILRDQAGRFHFQCSYVVPVASGL